MFSNPYYHQFIEEETTIPTPSQPQELGVSGLFRGLSLPKQLVDNEDL